MRNLMRNRNKALKEGEEQQIVIEAAKKVIEVLSVTDEVTVEEVTLDLENDKDQITRKRN